MSEHGKEGSQVFVPAEVSELLVDALKSHLCLFWGIL